MPRSLTQIALLAALVSLVGCDASAVEPDEPSASRSGTLFVLNDTPQRIEVANISPCTSANWGENQLSGILRPAADGRNGDAAEFDIEAGCWDLRALTDGGVEVTQFGQQIREEETVYWSVLLPGDTSPGSARPTAASSKR